MDEISKIILTLYKKKFQGIVNIGNGKKIHLKEIAKIICIRYQKKFEFIENEKPTYLIANNLKLKKYYNIKKYRFKQINFLMIHLFYYYLIAISILGYGYS